MRSRWSRHVALPLILGGVVAALLAVPLPARGAPSDDAWVAGYAAAVLERELNVRAPSLQVRDGVVTIDARDIPPAARPRVVGALERIRGVQRVEISDRTAPAAAATAPPAQSAPSPGVAPEPSVSAPPALGFLPRGRLFQPLIADPRWPRMSATYRYSLRGSSPTVFSPELGESVTLYRDHAGEDGRHGYWETGVQAGVFSIFDLDSSSLDLINSDFIVAIFGAYRSGPFSLFTRLYHQSSHLGD